MKQKVIEFANNSVVKNNSNATVEYRDKEILVIWNDFQIRFDERKSTLSIIKLNGGIATVVSYHNLKSLDGKLFLKPDRPCFHQTRFIEWCHEHHIDIVRSKVPNRTIGAAGQIFTDGVVTSFKDEYGCECRTIENATWTIIRYESETVLYTRTSVYKLNLPEDQKWCA